MIVRHLSLTNFRLYARLELDLSSGLTIVQGDNAQGKTSLLEAIYFLATAHSPHTHTDRQIIRWAAEEEAAYPFAILKAEVLRRDGPCLLEIGLQRADSGRLKKEIRINHAPRRGIDLVGQLAVVLFLPSDVEIVAGAPALRRRYLDAALSQVDAAYVRALDQYEHALAQRNALLRQAQERRVDPDEFAVWDEQLVPAGVDVALRRRRAVAELTQLALPVHRRLSNGQEYLEILYRPNFDPSAPVSSERVYQIGLDPASPPNGFNRADLETAFRRALINRRREEIARGATLTGPHRDDLRFIANGVDLGDYGSRGQQRTAVLSLKLAEADWMRARIGEAPVLLLDEVLAELDPNRRRCLLEHIGSLHQTIVTTTDVGRFDSAFVQQATVLTVAHGVLNL
ncbi:MAG: DNA replication/repair protein RecF [Anaerolineae bacterium]|nr:DNA replication/repair protein RecF [Thermoflexales bacterium]MDW8406396.1 DNA replication/repair protein RecF [Anaerolineae bacterium]